MKAVTDPIYDMDEIPHSFHGVELSESDRKRLAYGLSTNLINDLSVNGSVFDAKLTLRKDNNNEVYVVYDPYRESLTVPDTILGIKLTEENKKSLEAGKELGPFTYKSQVLYLSQDRELNSITIKTAEQKGIRDLIAGYELSESDKHKLASGERLSTRIFQGEDKPFSAEIQATINSDGTVSYHFNSYNEIHPDKLDSLKEEYNVDLSNREQMYFEEEIRVAKLSEQKLLAPGQKLLNTSPEAEINPKTDSPEEKQDNLSEEEINAARQNLNDSLQEEELKKKGFFPRLMENLKESWELANNPVVHELYKDGHLKDVLDSDKSPEEKAQIVMNSLDKHGKIDSVSTTVGTHIVQLVEKQQFVEIKNGFSNKYSSDEKVIGTILNSELSGQNKIAALTALGASKPSDRLLRYEKSVSNDKEGQLHRTERGPKKEAQKKSKSKSADKIKNAARGFDAASKNIFNQM